MICLKYLCFLWILFTFISTEIKMHFTLFKSGDNPKFMQNTQLQIWLYGLRVMKQDIQTQPKLLSCTLILINIRWIDGYGYSLLYILVARSGLSCEEAALEWQMLSVSLYVYLSACPQHWISPRLGCLKCTLNQMTVQGYTKPVYCTSVYKTSLLINNVHKTVW